jgi:hypothetical protein
MSSITSVNGKGLTPSFQIPKFLGATDVTADYKGQSADWFALQLIEKYGQLDGGEHYVWVLDQVARILLGAPVMVYLARWDDGTSELLYQTGEPSAAYRSWVRTVNYGDVTS